MRPNVDEVDSGVLLICEFRLDLNLRCLCRGDERVRISAKPFSTLEFLVQNRHRVVRRPNHFKGFGAAIGRSAQPNKLSPSFDAH